MNALDTLMDTTEWAERLAGIASESQSAVSVETGLTAGEYEANRKSAYAAAEAAAQAGQNELAASEYGAFIAYTEILDTL